MLKGSRVGIVRKIQPMSIHGQISLDVYFVDPEEEPEQVRVARLGPEAVPRDLEPGHRIRVEYRVGAAVSITKET